MPGKGPLPAKPAEKRRRNKPKEFEELPADGYRGDFPKLPKTYRVKVPSKDGIATRHVAFLKETKDWYETWARSPMATEFTDVHWRRLQMVAKLVDQYERNPLKDVLAEIRQHENSFGGTPYDLRRLGRTIVRGEEPAEKPRQAKRSQKRRANLRVVA
jgi:sulfur relay (sulfurtransferase) DsrC/TusE family protein